MHRKFQDELLRRGWIIAVYTEEKWTHICFSPWYILNQNLMSSNFIFTATLRSIHFYSPLQIKLPSMRKGKYISQGHTINKGTDWSVAHRLFPSTTKSFYSMVAGIPFCFHFAITGSSFLSIHPKTSTRTPIPAAGSCQAPSLGLQFSDVSTLQSYGQGFLNTHCWALPQNPRPTFGRSGVQPENLCSFSFLFNSFVETSFTYHTIQPF